jgi:hypothetical protein
VERYPVCKGETRGAEESQRLVRASGRLKDKSQPSEGGGGCACVWMPRAEHVTDAPSPRGTKSPGRETWRVMRAHLKTVPDAPGGRAADRSRDEEWGCNKDRG